MLQLHATFNSLLIKEKFMFLSSVVPYGTHDLSLINLWKLLLSLKIKEKILQTKYLFWHQQRFFTQWFLLDQWQSRCWLGGSLAQILERNWWWDLWLGSQEIQKLIEGQSRKPILSHPTELFWQNYPSWLFFISFSYFLIWWQRN